MMAPEAQAAHWEMTWRPDGASFSQNYGGSWEWVDFLNWWDGYNPTTGRVEGQEQVHYSGNFADGEGVQGGSEPFWRALNVTQKGSVTVYLKWVQDLEYGPGGPTPGPFVPAPKVVVLRIKGNAYASTQSPTSQSQATSSFGDIKGTEASLQFGNSFERTSDTHPENTPPTSQREVNIPLVVPQGSTEVQYTFPLETKAITQQMSAHGQNENNRPSANASFLIQVQRVDVGVAITSNIETSWKKWTGPVAALPNVYKQRDSNSHQLLNEPNNNAVLVAPHPTDPTKDIWRLAIFPAPSGTMIVQSAAQWMTSPDQTFKGWLGGARFTAVSEGIETPSYNWTEPPLSHNQNNGQTPAVDNLTPAAPTFGSPYYGIRLGSNPNGSDLVKSSTISVAVSGSNIPAPIPCDYIVDWHLPQEWEPNPYRTATLPPTIFSQAGYIVDSQNHRLENIEPNLAVNFDIESEVTTYRMDTKDNVSTVATVLGTSADAAGVVVISSVVAAAAGATIAANPVAWLALALGVAAGGASYAAGQMPDPTPGLGHTDYAQYKSAMKFQKIVNDARKVDPNAYPDVVLSRCDNPVAVDDAVAEINRVEQNPSTILSPWEQDKFFHQNEGTMRCRVTAGREQKSDLYKGDEFGKHGYVGRCSLEAKRSKNIFYVYKWTYTPNTSPPPDPNQTP